MLDPVHVAWRHLGCPRVAGEAAEGVCARCGTTAKVRPVRTVVSAQFTGFDQLSSLGDGFCQPCCWAFDAKNRRLILAITPSATQLLDAPGLYDRLLAPVRSALVVPLGGRKHVLPYAQWGSLRVDDINLQWTTEDSRRLGILAGLRGRGVPVTSLVDVTPPWKWLKTQPQELLISTQREWEALKPWRGSAYLSVAVKATQHLKGQP